MSDQVLDMALTRAKAHGAQTVEAFISESMSLDVGVRMGNRDSIERSESRDLSLRVFVNGAQAAAITSDFSQSAVDALAARAVAMARAAPADPYCGLADAEDQGPEHPMDLYDAADADAQTLEDWARTAENAALENPKIENSVGAGAQRSESTIHLRTSAGLARVYRASGWSIWMTALAKQDEQMERDSDWSSTRFRGDLADPTAIGREAGRRAAARLGARKLSTRTCDVIFDHRVATRLVGPFLGAIAGPSVARGVSFLKDKLGKAVFSSELSIIDDPFLPRGLGSAPCDREGVKRQRSALADKGVLTTWLMESASARQLNMRPTGHASWNAGGPPSVASSNVWVEAGRQSADAMMASLGSGLLVTDMFGPSLNGNTGDWSAGASGFWFENGAIAYPVNEITVAGNLLDIYARMIPASDLSMLERINSPSLLVEKLTVAGT